MLKGLRAINHVAISVVHWDAMVDFYTRVLGFEAGEVFGWDTRYESDPRVEAITGLPDSAARGVLLTGSTIALELFEFLSPSTRRQGVHRLVCDPGFTHLAFDVEGIDGVYAALQSQGMEFHGPVQTLDDGTRLIYGRDPDGNVLELQESPA